MEYAQALCAADGVQKVASLINFNDSDHVKYESCRVMGILMKLCMFVDSKYVKAFDCIQDYEMKVDESWDNNPSASEEIQNVKYQAPHLPTPWIAPLSAAAAACLVDSFYIYLRGGASFITYQLIN